MDTIDALRQTSGALVSLMETVSKALELHYKNSNGNCAECVYAYPCNTVEILEGMK